MYESGYNDGAVPRQSYVVSNSMMNPKYTISSKYVGTGMMPELHDYSNVGNSRPIGLKDPCHGNFPNGYKEKMYVEPFYAPPVMRNSGTPISKKTYLTNDASTCSKNPHCLGSAFPCFAGSNIKTTTNTNGIRTAQKGYAVNNRNNTYFNEPPRRTFYRGSHEQLFPPPPTTKQVYESRGDLIGRGVCNRKINSYEQLQIPDEFQQHRNEKRMSFACERYQATPPVNNLPLRNDLHEMNKQTLKDPMNHESLSQLIQMKDQQIKELERSIGKDTAVNDLSEAYENNKLKEKLLDQKIKYEEMLKHVKKLEHEKRNLKKNLTVRDKVLTKLEDEIADVDHENDFLLKVKDKGDLNEIHNVFKFLHGDAQKTMKRTLKKGPIFNSDVDSEMEMKQYKYKGKMEEENSIVTNEEDEDDYVYKKKSQRKPSKKSVLDKNDVYMLKNTVVALEKEIRDLKEENKNVNFKYENTFKTLSELRKDTLEYMESIVSRDMRIAYMETTLQKCEKDLFKLREHFKKTKRCYEEKIDQLTSEIKVLEKQSSHLQEMIQEKDAQIVLLKNEIVRNETLIKQYEQRNRELQSELKVMCSNLENVIEASNKKDLFMNELEKQLRENEVTRQHAYLKEVAKNRKVHTDLKFKEILYDKSAMTKMDELHQLKQELFLNNIHVQKAKDAFEVLRRAPKKECLLPPSKIDYSYHTNTQFDSDNPTNEEAQIESANTQNDSMEAKMLTSNCLNDTQTYKVHGVNGDLSLKKKKKKNKYDMRNETNGNSQNKNS